MARKRQLDQAEAPQGSEARAEAQVEQRASLGQETPAQAEGGNVSPMPAASPAAETPAVLSRTRVRDRLIARDDWPDISKLAKEMRSECNRKRMDPEDREDFVWSELDRLYPPSRETASTPNSVSAEPNKTCEISKAQSVALLDSGRVQGLGDLPPGWPELPANASLTAEIGWVQANRLYVVEELDRGGTRVHLDRAHEPAPSRAAIGWLETSIRSYAKYVEVAAKATGAGQDEQAQERQERLDLDGVRALLAEML